jgi:hypothetical protein
MKRKPWSLITLAVLHWISPFGNLLINSYKVHASPVLFANALLEPVNLPHLLVLIFLPIIAGVLILICRKWSYVAYIVLMIIPFIYSFYYTHGDFGFRNISFVLSLYVVNMFIVGYFMIPNIRRIYFDPRLRWWQSSPRFSADFAAALEQADGKLNNGQIKNISVGGFFIELEANLQLEATTTIKFKFQDQEYQIIAKPVFRKNRLPTGYGFKADPKNAKINKLEQIVEHLKSQGAIIQGREPTPEDSFMYWLKTAWKSKRAWIPEIK